MFTDLFESYADKIRADRIATGSVMPSDLKARAEIKRYKERQVQAKRGKAASGRVLMPRVQSESFFGESLLLWEDCDCGCKGKKGGCGKGKKDLEERRTKAQQLRGLARTTGHIPTPDGPDGIEAHPAPRRTKPAPKKGWDTFPRKVRDHKEVEKGATRDLARGASTSISRHSPAARSISSLRKKRDEVTPRTKRRAEAARRLPIKFPGKKR